MSRISEAKKHADAMGWGSFIFTTTTGEESVYVKFGNRWKMVGKPPSSWIASKNREPQKGEE